MAKRTELESKVRVQYISEGAIGEIEFPLDQLDKFINRIYNASFDSAMKTVKFLFTLPDLDENISQTFRELVMDKFTMEGPGWPPRSPRTKPSRPELLRSYWDLLYKSAINPLHDYTVTDMGVRYSFYPSMTIPYFNIQNRGGMVRHPGFISKRKMLRAMNKGKPLIRRPYLITIPERNFFYLNKDWQITRMTNAIKTSLRSNKIKRQFEEHLFEEATKNILE
jgi:hypothetical protein